MNMKNRDRRSYGQFSVGIFLLFAGGGLLLHKFDLFTLEPIWHYWPVILIAMGLGKLFDAQVADEYRKACWMLLMGGWCLISELHLFGFNYRSSWPILLIGLGIMILWKSIEPSSNKVKEHCHGI